MSLCKYRDVLGKPKQGFHKHFLGVAIGDLVGTILVCVLIWKIFHVNFWLVLLIALLLGIILHRIFCVNTTINKSIFGEV
jgi:hypothetical protein